MTTNKNIIFMISSYAGGPGDVLKELLKYNDKYNIYCISLSNSYRDDILNVVKNKSSKYWILDKKDKFSLKIFFKLKNIFKEVNPKVIYSFDFASNVYSRFFINNYIKWFPMIRGLESAFVWWRVIIQKQIFKRANNLIVPSDALVNKATMYKLMDEDKVIRIYNGTKLESKKKKLSNFKDKKKFIVGVVANFYDEVKGHRYALETIALLPQNFTLEFIGDGVLQESIQKEAKKIKVINRLKFHGYLEKEQIINLMIERFDVLLVPSISESFGKVIIEAMSVGLPVVATNVGGIPEIILNRKTGCLVESKNSGQMALVIEQVVKDEAMYKQFSQNSIKRVEENFDIKTMAKDYFEVINEN